MKQNKLRKSTPTSGRKFFCHTLFILALLIFIQTSANAATFTVTNTNDNGASSLRQAVLDANGTAAADVIDFNIPAGSCPAGVCTITLTSGELAVNSAATAGTLTIINSTGASNLLISGNDTSRVFFVNTGANLAISGVTITKGNGTGTDARFNGFGGGGIYNLVNGTLTLTNSTISGNTATNGGGIINVSGTLTLTNSTVSGNTASNSGGGINGDGGTTILTSSTVSGNTAQARGAGLYFSGGTHTISGSTISGNTNTVFDGGGIFASNSANLTVVNSTVSGNSGYNGGGIYTDNATTILRNDTFVGNKSFGTVGALAGVFVNPPNGGKLSVGSTIVTDSVDAGNASIPDIISEGNGTFTSAGYNLVRNRGTASGTASSYVATDLPNGTNPKLGPLADNGGATQTHALLFGSPAIDKGNSFGLTTDQRGLTRPVDLPDATYPNAAGGDGADIGAVEAQTAPSAVPPLTLTVTRTDDRNMNCLTGDCSLREAVNAANAATTNDTINFAIPAGDAGCTAGICTITLTSGELAVNDAATAGTLTITNSTGASNLLISGNNTSRVFFVNSGANLTINGVTITKGNGTGTFAGFGGGIFNNGGTLTLTNSTVNGNTATNNGGGIHNSFGTMTLTNSTVSGNTASSQSGGGIDINGGTLTLTNSTVSSNMASSFGGGINNVGNGTLTLTNSTVSGNTVNRFGGGIFNNGTTTLNNSTVSGNTASNSGGGGIFNQSGITLTNSTVSGNTANGNSGGGIFNSSNGTTTLTNSTVSGNMATFNGGGIFSNSGTTTLNNSTVSSNTASLNGGILNFGGTLNLTSVTVTK